MKDQRRSERRTLFYAARIEDGSKGAPRICTVSDISESGARIRLETPAPVPDQFILQFAATGTVQRECHVMWRKGEDLGVLFKTPLSEQCALLAADETNWTVDDGGD